MDGLQHWTDVLDHRERAQIEHAIDYADRHAASGAPGHGQFMLIAKLAKLLTDQALQLAGVGRASIIQKVAWDEKSKSWRDLLTGVRVEL